MSARDRPSLCGSGIRRPFPAYREKIRQNVTYGPIAYNAAHQIISRTTNNSLYDFGGYATGVINKTANGLNQDAAIAALSGGYDGNGNEGNDGVRTFAYDAENRLTSVAIPSTSTSVALTYDPTGRLQQEVATISGAATTTQFLYAGSKLVAEYTGAGVLTQRYVHGAGTDEPLVWYPGATTATRNWLHADNQGSVISYSSLTGTTTSATTYSYGAYGEPNAWGGSRFRYTGQIMLPEVQLYYYKARVYDPISGHFLQTDPIGYKDNLDLYEYVGDDPVDKADPTGNEEHFASFLDAIIPKVPSQASQSQEDVDHGMAVQNTRAVVAVAAKSGTAFLEVAAVAPSAPAETLAGAVTAGAKALFTGQNVRSAAVSAQKGAVVSGASAMSGAVADTKPGKAVASAFGTAVSTFVTTGDVGASLKAGIDSLFGSLVKSAKPDRKANN